MGSEEEYSESQWDISKNYGDLSRFTTIEVDIYRQHGPKFIEIFDLSIGVALQVIEYLKAAEIVFQRLATLDDIATVSGQKKATHSTNVNKLVKKQILTKFRENGKIVFAPHPRFYEDGTLPESARISIVYAADDEAATGHELPFEASLSGENDPMPEKGIDQEGDLANNVQMKLIVDHHRALRDEIWDRLGNPTAKKARTIVMAQVLDVLVAVGETNEWVPIQALADASGGKLSWASKLTTDLEKLGIVEKMKRAPDKGLSGAIALARLSPAFLLAVQSRSLLSSSPQTPTQPPAPSSSARSTSDSLQA